MTTTLALPRNPRFVDFHNRSFTSADLQLLADSLSLVRLNFKECKIGDEELALLCHLPKLQSMWLEGTGVTDAALAHLARLPKLDWLDLDNTAITGAGFAAFHGHPTLRYLWMRHTDVADDVIPLLVSMSQLSIVGLEGTSVTEAGLMALAAHPTVKLGGNPPFQADVLARFADLQRQRASRTPPGFSPVQADEDAARAALLGFMAAITEWEREMASTSPLPADWKVEQVRAAYATFCTVKDRKYGGPNALSFGTPPTYEDAMIFASEWIGPSKVVFYTRDSLLRQERFVLMKKAGRWLLDHKEVLGDGWERAFL